MECRGKGSKRGKDSVHPGARIIDLYRSGWTLVDIAATMDRSIREVVEVLRSNGVFPRPEHMQEAEAYLNQERELALVLRKRTPSGNS